MGGKAFSRARRGKVPPGPEVESCKADSGQGFTRIAKKVISGDEGLLKMLAKV